MSGLLVKSTLVMRDNLELMNERGITTPVILGGAALNRRYVDQDLVPLYKGQLFYARDAFDGLHAMDKLVSEPAALAAGQSLGSKAPVEQPNWPPADAGGSGEGLVGEDAKLG